MYTNNHITKEDQISWFEIVNSAGDNYYWIIEYDGKPIGLASITAIDRVLESCYWAFYIGDSSVRGGGVGSGVELFIIEYVFNKLRLNKLRCEVFSFNEKVISMHEKYGFRREAYYREHCYKNGSFQDVVGLALLKKDWERIRVSFARLIDEN